MWKKKFRLLKITVVLLKISYLNNLNSFLKNGLRKLVIFSKIMFIKTEMFEMFST